MNNIHHNVSKTIKTLALAAFAGTIGFLSSAPVGAQTLPSYANANGDETITGTVSAINGQYNISVNDVRGFVDNVSLHQGTIINPTGLTLAPGERVTIMGHPQGGSFVANEIDTPYRNVAVVPVYPGYVYGYPAYRVGVQVGRGFGFGFRGW